MSAAAKIAAGSTVQGTLAVSRFGMAAGHRWTASVGHPCMDGRNVRLGYALLTEEQLASLVADSMAVEVSRR